VVIAIDGPSGVGKSTVTRAVADRLGCASLDTGATYRAATLAVLRAGIDPADEPAVVSVVAAADIDVSDGAVRLDGEVVSDAIREGEVTSAVSGIAAIPGVRRLLVALQRHWVESRGGEAVVEGRDIGTVVFPGAPVKVFLTAPAEVRAVRRAGDDESSGRSVDDVGADLERRDHADATRAASPLQPADDAVVIDTGRLTVDAVVDEILRLVAERNGQQRPV
jgi:cytidylate kinase